MTATAPTPEQALISRIAANSRPLSPEPTGVSPSLPLLPGVRAVLFDFYGTMFVSASGDIATSRKEGSAGVAEAALRQAGLQSLARSGEQDISLRLKRAIEQEHQRLRSQDCDHPEVDIREMWKQVLTGMIEDHRLTAEAVAHLSVAYECTVNPTWPMPGLQETLTALRRAGILLGIVSNAQFFTPLTFQALLGMTLLEAGFDDGLMSWSYKMRLAKPSEKIYEPVLATLAGKGISPGHALFVGNDMLNDVLPAHRLGMKTVLFAGDRRSLRMRNDDSRCMNLKPDAVITALSQLIDIVGASQ